MKTRFSKCLTFSFLLGFIIFLSSTKSYGASVTTPQECKDEGGTCYSAVTCPTTHILLGACSMNNVCCKVKPTGNECTDKGYTCSPTSPGSLYKQVSYSCSNTADKCWALITECTHKCVPTGKCKEIAIGNCGSNEVCCKKEIVDLFCAKYGEPCEKPSDCCTGMTCNINTCGPSLNDSYKGPKITNWQELISPVARILYYGALFIGFCYVVISGYMLMTSEGDPKKTQDAQGQLTAAIIGIIFVLLSAAILRVIINSLIGGNISI
ncbi:DUF4282 domain-containing protein [candidate division WWE3 bacterium]|uniref:DUF4282 domain-containing protein n=1 Tax=candidate division WWE3 bacterium TaxID=2053526 RepID=A0A7X9E7I8_UNCKA|nr:DUF4282 domain-containing protein [candidate division WWE3 bacterium]